MPVVVVHQGPSLTQDKYEEAVRRLTDGKNRLESLADWPAEGILFHTAGQGEDGFRVVDVWESEEAFGRFGEVLGPIMQEIGVDDLPEVYVAHTFVSD
jgi:hypothetical protein